MKAKQPDWEAIERAYRAGLLSLRAIADKYQSSEGTIRSRAKKHGWLRDLTDQVRSATQEKISRSASRSDVTQQDVREDAEIIEEASAEAADVILAHRKKLKRWGLIAAKLAKQMEIMEVSAESVGEFSRSLNAGVDAELKLIKGQRQAYNLDTETGDKTVSDLASLMDELSKEA